MKPPVFIDQFCAGFSSGDAISNEALIIQSHLCRLGYKSKIYCEQFTEKDAERVIHFRHYHKKKNSILIYHHSFHTEILSNLHKYPAQKILIFHNITPPEYVEPYNRQLALSLRMAQEELSKLTEEFSTVIAVSNFNAETLRRLRFSDIKIMPVPVKFNSSGHNEIPHRLRYLMDGCINILFTGRIFPNKKHQDLLKSFYFFRKIVPRSRLLIVGPFHPGVRGYTAELFNLNIEMGISEDVVFTGMVSNEELRAFNQHSSLFLSMSEHEGFFVPLLESMHYNLPILAFGSSVIPETLGESGVIFYKKDYCMVAELMAGLVNDLSLRESVIEAQNRRFANFRAENSLSILDDTLRGLGAVI